MRFARPNKSYLKFFFGILAAATLSSSLTSCKQDSKTTITRHINHPWEKDIGYAESVEVNGTVYISGAACGGETYAIAVPDCYSQLKDKLTRLNLTPQNIIKENVYTKDIEALKEQIPARKDFYGNDNYPAATWVQVSRLYKPEFLVEVELIAVRTE
jgi:2-iminobutanoate/2-iminopropanoate deaminase